MGRNSKIRRLRAVMSQLPDLPVEQENIQLTIEPKRTVISFRGDAAQKFCELWSKQSS